MKQIAILITCFNRKDKTLSCLKSIYEQEDIDKYQVEVFIVDGGSKDGTIEAVNEQYPKVHIELHDGLYWAGGMRAAWKMATANGNYDYFWLLNDDTKLKNNTLKKLLIAEEWCITNMHNHGIIVGATANSKGEYSYGGNRLHNLNHSKGEKLKPATDKPVEIDEANANIMLIPKEVYQVLGGLTEVYTHGLADFDYTLRARHANIPVLLAPNYLGICENDHGNSWKSQRSPLKDRVKFMYSPKGLAYHEYLYFIKKFFPSEYYSAKFKLWMKTLFPIIWSKFKK
jgi:GT2 family glycosyltransferase